MRMPTNVRMVDEVGTQVALHPTLNPRDDHGSTAATDDLRAVYSGSRLTLYALAAVVGAVLIAGFWNYHLVDGFGRDVIAGSTIGDTAALADGYVEHGTGFGFLFAVIAGLAATF